MISMITAIIANKKQIKLTIRAPVFRNEKVKQS